MQTPIIYHSFRTGMVSVCAGCDAYYPWTAASLGVIAAVFYLMGSLTLVALKIDDPLDAFPIHCIAGIHINMSISLTLKQIYQSMFIYEFHEMFCR